MNDVKVPAEVKAAAEAYAEAKAAMEQATADLLAVYGRLSLSWTTRHPDPADPVDYEAVNELTAIMVGWCGLDGVTPLVYTDEEGVKRRAMAPQQGHDEDYIALGHKDLTRAQWNEFDILGPDGKQQILTHEQKLQNVRDYKGGLRQKFSTWTNEAYIAAYLETHDAPE